MSALLCPRSEQRTHPRLGCQHGGEGFGGGAAKWRAREKQGLLVASTRQGMHATGNTAVAARASRGRDLAQFEPRRTRTRESERGRSGLPSVPFAGLDARQLL